jgi:MobA/VirD2-like, nuclease domain
MPRRLIDLQKGEPLLDVASYGRRGPGARLSPQELQLITYTARRTPEVMVKVSGGGTSSRGALAHLKYIDRRGRLEIETDQGEIVKGGDAENTLVADWELDLPAAESRSPYRGRAGRKAAKLVHNIVLSMPAGTPPAKLLAASREFAREEFAVKHRHAMVLHTDQDHPHVHLLVKAVSENGKRLNIRKATLRDWRRQFAAHLPAQGIAANATERAVRGQVRAPVRDGIYRAALRGQSTHHQARLERIVHAARSGPPRPLPST